MKKSDAYQKLARARKTKITFKDAQKAFKHPLIREGKEWVIRQGGREIRNSDKKEAIVDWFTINGYEVV